MTNEYGNGVIGIKKQKKISPANQRGPRKISARRVNLRTTCASGGGGEKSAEIFPGKDANEKGRYPDKKERPP